MTSKKEIAQLLLDKRAVGLRTDPPYTWSSGAKRPMYCDNRLLISYPKERKIIIDGFKRLIEENNLAFDVIGGTASAAVPWASFLAYELDVPMVYIKKTSKGYGTDKLVEGTMQEGSRILIVEDLISTGGSAIRAAQACAQQYNATTVAVLAIFTYQMQEALESFSKTNYSLYSLSDFNTLVELAHTQNYISDKEKEEIDAWAKNPDAWDAKHNNT